MRVANIVGARPQFVKAAVVSRELRLAGASDFLIHTGQHYDDHMSQIFFDELQIPHPKYNLGIGSGSHGSQTGRMLETTERVLLEEEPDWAVVYGDTNSTLAGALAAVKLHIPLAHVEAGLRSFNRGMPEEINRILTDHAADLLFAPTRAAVTNLHGEGIAADKIHFVGDVMYDAALLYAEQAGRCSRVLQRLSLEPKRYVLATVHRAENTDNAERLRAIASAFAQLSREIPVVFPIHPRTRQALVHALDVNGYPREFMLVDPVGYLDMVMLEKNAALIATDSGGLQKEAFFYEVGCVTLREETEWVELVELGWNRVLPPTSAGAILNGLHAGLAAPPGHRARPYANGSSSRRIAQTLMRCTLPEKRLGRSA